MAITFNADEIFEMAVEIERNGAKFYREAAANTSDEQTKKMLLDLADMEQGHLSIFEQMRQSLTDAQKEATTFDPDNEAAMYLRTMADAHGSEGLKSPTEKLTGNESIREIIEIALNSEKDSVIFYFGLKGFVSAKAGRDKVEAIIKEELAHITILNKQLKALDN
jgi:rubrerythrin